MPRLAHVLLAGLALFAVARSDDFCNGDPDKDNFPDKIVVGSSSNFTISYSNNYKILTNQIAGEAYGLYCGSDRPSAPGKIKAWFQVPITSVAVLDRTLVPYLEALKLTSTIKIVQDPQNVTSPCVQSLLSDGSAKSQASASADDWAPVQVAFTNTYSNDSSYVAFSASNDHLYPLEKAEWIKFISVFFNAEGNATEFYQHVNAQYDCHTNNIAKVNKQQIAWSQSGKDLETGDDFWTLQSNAYVERLTSDAGGHLVSSSSGVTNDTSRFQTDVATANFVVDQTDVGTGTMSFDGWLKTFGYSEDPKSTDNSFYFQKQVWRTDKLRNQYNNYDWGQTSFARPDLALADLITMQYPKYHGKIDDAANLQWMNNLAQPQDIVRQGSASCDKTPLVSTFPQCPSSPNLTLRDESSSSSDGLNGARIAGIVIGSVAGLVLLGILYVFLARRRRRQRLQEFINLRNRNSGELDDQREAM
ncbi:hypothetical protein H4R33_003271 [Dimargaris cristalligena]|nr:hypothetical protein H4R33_003271 [Dimargaris cristalligena]